MYANKYIAINVQFMNNNMEVIIYTLAVKDTNANHSSESIKKIVCDVLDGYGLKKEHILAIVTDNASNMISTIKKINQSVTKYQLNDSDEDTIDVSTSSASEDYDPEPDESYRNPDFSDEFYFSLDTTVIDSRIHHMQCAVHTLQSAICDALNGRYASKLIGIVRSIAIRARNLKIDAILKRSVKIGAIIDQSTRWGSTYLMIERIFQLKFILSDMANPDLRKSDAHWEQMENLKEILPYPFLVTKKLN